MTAKRRQMSNEWIRNWAREYRKRPYVIEQHKIERKRYRAKKRLISTTKLDRLKAAAWSKVKHAVSMGYIKPLPCQECGQEPTHAHHDDYSKPLDIQWLCYQHHADIHVAKKNALVPS